MGQITQDFLNQLIAMLLKIIPSQNSTHFNILRHVSDYMIKRSNNFHTVCIISVLKSKEIHLEHLNILVVPTEPLGI